MSLQNVWRAHPSGSITAASALIMSFLVKGGQFGSMVPVIHNSQECAETRDVLGLGRPSRSCDRVGAYSTVLSCLMCVFQSFGYRMQVLRVTEVRYSPVPWMSRCRRSRLDFYCGNTCGCSTSLVCSTGSIGEQSPSPVRLLERTTRGHYALH